MQKLRIVRRRPSRKVATRPAQRVSGANLWNSLQIVIVVVKVHVGVVAPILVAHQLNVGKELENAVAIKVSRAHETSMVQMQRIIVGVTAVHKVVLVGRVCNRVSAFASRVARKKIVANPHQIVSSVDTATSEHGAVVDVVYDGLFR